MIDAKTADVSNLATRFVKLLSPRSSVEPRGTAGAMTIGRAAENDIVISDVLASREHASLTSTPLGTEIRDTSINGTFVNGTRVGSAILTEDDVVTIGNVDLVFRNSTLVQGSEAATRTGGLEVRDVKYVVDNGKQLLDNISLTARPGTLTAVIGGSGAGKSTLARLIAGYTTPSSGSVTFAGHNIHTEYASLRSRIGMVPQDDVVHRQLTVNQALGYAAELRLPPDTSKADRAKVVTQVLEELDLTKHADTRVDKLSGGQRKRASVALELLTGPSLLILDEPTSGLDPALDHQVMMMLRAAGRRRPRGDRGDAHAVLPGHLRPAAAGRAGRQDGLLRTAGPDRRRDGHHQLGQDLHPGGRRSRRSQPALPGAERGARKRPARADRAERPRRTRPHQPAAPDLDDRPPAGPPGGLRPRLLLLPGAAAVRPRCAVADGSRPQRIPHPRPERRHTRRIRPDLSLLLPAAAFMGTALTIRDLVGERAIFQREQAVGLSTTAYLLAKTAVFCGFAILQSAIITAIVLIGKGAPTRGAVLLGHGTVGATFELFTTVAATCVASAILGLAISALVRSSEQIMPLFVVAVMAQLVLCGGMVPVTGRLGLDQLSFAMPARWGYAAAASTVDVRHLVPGSLLPQDRFWEHTSKFWLIDMGMLAALSLFYACFVRWKIRLRR